MNWNLTKKFKIDLTGLWFSSEVGKALIDTMIAVFMVLFLIVVLFYGFQCVERLIVFRVYFNAIRLLDSLVIIKLLGSLVNVCLIFLWFAEMWKMWKEKAKSSHPNEPTTTNIVKIG